MCFTPSGIRFMQDMAQGYARCIHLNESDTNMSSSTGVSQLLSSGVISLMKENEKIAASITSIRGSGDSSNEICSVLEVLDKSNLLMGKLLEILHTNAFVTAVVMDCVFPNAF